MIKPESSQMFFKNKMKQLNKHCKKRVERSYNNSGRLCKIEYIMTSPGKNSLLKTCLLISWNIFRMTEGSDTTSHFGTYRRHLIIQKDFKPSTFYSISTMFKSITVFNRKRAET